MVATCHLLRCAMADIRTKRTIMWTSTEPGLYSPPGRERTLPSDNSTTVSVSSLFLRSEKLRESIKKTLAHHREHRPLTPRHTLDAILSTTEKEFNINHRAICGRGRNEELMKARKCLMFVAYCAGYSMKQVAYYYGFANHTTIKNHIDTFIEDFFQWERVPFAAGIEVVKKILE